MVRMEINKNIVDSDKFIDMASDAKILYFYLLMEADIQGIVTNVFATARKLWQIEDEDAIHQLIENGYLIKVSDFVYRIANGSEE